MAETTDNRRSGESTRRSKQQSFEAGKQYTPLAEVRYQLVFPEGAAHLTPQADQAPAVLRAFLRGDTLALRLADGRVVALRLTEQHLGGRWSAVLTAPEAPQPRHAE